MKQCSIKTLSQDPVLGRQVVRLLGWDATHVLTLDILGTSLVVAAVLDDQEVGWRDAERIPPLADPWVLRCHVDADPRLLRRAPVRLVGALAMRQRWPAARAAASVFTAFGRRAAVIPRGRLTSAAETEAAVTGIGIVVTGDGRAEEVAPAGEPPPTRRGFVHRVVEESVWSAICRGARPT